MSPLTNTLHLQLTPMPHATSTLTTITKSSPIIKNSSDNPISHAPSSSGTIYHQRSKPPIPYRSSSTIYTLITKPNCLPTYHRHVLKPETTGTKPPEQPERNHRNNRNDRNKNRKRPEPPKPKSNMEFHILDLPTCISRPILRIYVIVNS
jgi:hypothetical protein